MSLQRQKLVFMLSAFIVLWSSLLVQRSMAQNNPCEVYGEGYVCSNDTRASHNVPFDDPLTCEQNLYENVMKLLEDGEKILEDEFALADSDEAVMMIGNTGTGKSTLTYFLAGDNSKMFSYEKGTDNFLIKDCNGKIGSGDSTIVSSTIYPDLVIENSTGAPFYDNPGFQDTRTACVEIANAYFMRQIASHIKKVKFVIVVNQFEVKPGGSRDAFTKALANVFNFVPNIEKFGSGLSLVATKLDAKQSTDDPYLKDVVKFMNESRDYFPEIFENPDDLRKATFIVDSIADVSQVGVFRMPSECGPLSEIELMQNNRANIMKVILENIQYVGSSPDDFALTISAEAQIKVQTVGTELARNIQTSVQTFSSAIFNFLSFHFTCVQTNNCDELVEDFKILFSNPDFNNEYDVGDFAGLNFTEIIQRIAKKSFIPPKVLDSLPVDFIEGLVQSAGHLDFMSNLATLNVDTRPWLQPLKDTHGYLKEHVGGLINDIDQTFIRVLRELSKDFESVFKDNLKLWIDRNLTDSTQFEATAAGLNQSSYELSQNVKGLKPSQYVEEIRENLDLFKIGFSDQDYLESQLLILSQLSLNLDFLTKSFNNSFSVSPDLWVAPLISLKSNVSERFRLEVPNVQGKIENSVHDFSDAIYNYFVPFTCVQQNNCDDLVEDFKFLFSNPDFINEYDAADFAGLTFTEFIQRIIKAFFVPPKLLASLPEDLIEGLIQNAGHLDFIHNLVTLNVDVRPWLQFLKDTHGNLKKDVGGLISDIEQKFVKVSEELSEDFRSSFECNLKSLIDGKLGDSTQFEAAAISLGKSSYDLTQNNGSLKPSEYVTEIKENIDLFRMGFSNETFLNSQLLILSELSSNLDFLTKSFNSSFSVRPDLWIAPLISLKSNVSERIRLEIQNVERSIGANFSYLLLLLEDHFSQLNGNTADVLYQNLDIARRQFDFLNAFSKSITKGQLRKDFMGNLKLACDLINGIFIILGSQNFTSDIIRFDSALTVLERVDNGKLGVIVDTWRTDTTESSTTILDHIFNFASTDVSNIVESGANATTFPLIVRLNSAYEVTDADYPFDKQRNFISDYQKIRRLVSELSTNFTTLKLFASKNFTILTQLTQAASIPESSLQKLPGQNLKVDLDDLGQNPYNVLEWTKFYQDALGALTTIKNTLKADRLELQSPRTTDRGRWGDMDMCPDGTFVSGMQLKDDQCTPGTADCAAVTSVLFLCSALNGNRTVKTIMSSQEHEKGGWRATNSCPGFSKAVGFELNVEVEKRGLGGWVGDLIDDVVGAIGNGWCTICFCCGGGGGGGGGGSFPTNEATVNMRLFCDDGTTLEGDNSLDNKYGGSWTGEKRCEAGQYLCGLKTQVQYSADDYDLTGLNNVDVTCCYIVSSIDKDV